MSTTLQRPKLLIARQQANAPLDPDGVDVEQVAPHGWRVCDARLPRGHAQRLLGFVEKRGNEFEVIYRGRGSQLASFLSMQEALIYLLGTSAEPQPTLVAGGLS